MEFIKIIWLSILSAVVYGILHDQITARICVEYFTIGHPPVFNTVDPTLLAFGWGIIATWWVGLLLGIPMACCALLGSRPKLCAINLIQPIAILLLCMAVLSLISGVAGYAAASSGTVYLLEPMKSRVPAEKHVAFVANLWAHLAAYFSGAIGGIIVCVRLWRRRQNT